MAQLLGNVAVGTVLKLNENGSPQNYIVVHQGLPSSMYDASCNGTWLLRQNIFTQYKWDNDESNAYLTSNLVEFLEGDIIPLFSSSIQSVIKTVKIPYCVGGGSSTIKSGANGYSCKLFLLSGTELGINTSSPPETYGSILPQCGAKLSYFLSGTGTSAQQKRIAKYNGSSGTWWLRDPDTSGTTASWVINPDGRASTGTTSVANGCRWALILPTDLIVDDSNNINQLVPPINITVPSIAMQQQTLPVSWTSVSVAGADVTYQLQRNADNSGWTTIYTGADTSYTDTVGTWTQVQYQVATIALGATSNYIQSSIIPVSDPAVLVISGSDGNLGTLTSNVPYTVSSNTGNQISLTRTVNGAQVVTLTVDSGFAYSIPVADLPTGTGTIQITASVEDTSQQIQTATRTWTYYKTPIDIPSTGGIAQLTQNGQNIWPITVPDAVEAPVYLGGNLNAALNKLGQAALYTKIGRPKYNQVMVDLSKVSVGDEVLLPYNDVMVSHIVVQIGNPDPSMYDSSCDGVWLLRKDCVAQGQWNSTNINTLAGSTIMSTMAGYITNYDSEVQSAIKTVKIPYCIGGGNTTINSGSNGLECKIFPLGAYELGFIQSYNQYIPIDGTKLDYFNQNNSTDEKRIGYYNGGKVIWYTRTPSLANSNTSLIIETFSIPFSFSYVNSTNYYRPCFIMPTTFNQTYYVDSSNNIYPSQEYTQGGSITDVFGYDIPIAQSESGTYVGTGTYGVGNQTSISLSFTPKFICITNQTDSSKRAFLPYGGYGVCWTQSTITSSSISAYGLSTTWTQTGISWYNSSSAVQQMNESGDTYQYTVFG